MKSTLIFSIILLFNSIFSFSQEIQISEEKKYHLGIDNVFSSENGGFFVESSNPWTGAEGTLEYYSEINASPVKKEIEKKIQGKKAEFFKFLKIDNRLLAFLYTKSYDIYTLYCQEYGKDCLPVGEVKELYSFEREKDGWGTFNIIRSRDKNFFVVENLGLPKNEKEDFKFKVFDSKLELVNEGSYSTYIDRKLKNPELKYSVYKKELSNYGEFFVGVRELISDDDPSDNYILWTFKDGRQKVNTINLGGKVPVSFLIVSENIETIKCIGFCTDSIERGVFYVEIDLEKNRCNGLNFHKMEDQGKSRPTVTDVFELANGDYFVMSEFFHDRSIVNSAGRSVRVYYDDIKGFNFGRNGDFKWLTSFGHSNQILFPAKFEKSYIGYLKNDSEYVMILNGNITNDGIGSQAEFTVANVDPTNLKNNCFSEIKVDLESGDFERNCKEVPVSDQLILQPVHSELNESEKKIVLTFDSGKDIGSHRFGVISF